MEGDIPQEVDIDIEIGDAVSVAASSLTGTYISTLDEPPKEPSFDSVPAINSYQIKPLLQDKFKANPVKEIIRLVLSETLTGKEYDAHTAKNWTIDISNEINSKVRELRMKRYKHVVQVTMGELKGAGVKSGVRCLWDSETDSYTSDIFMNETIFCCVVVFAVYLY